MSVASVTEAEVDWILGASLDVDSDVVWEQKQNRVWVEATLRVRSSRENGSIQIRLTHSYQTPDEPAVSILYRGARIRARDLNGSHKNDHTDVNRWIKQTHEHRWTEACHGAWAFAPSADLPLRFETAFRDFCARHGVAFHGRWSEPPGQFQLGLLEES